MANLWALLDRGLIHDEDHLLLPLPLHHVYPFTVGLLAPLAAGVPIILPFSLTGRQLLRALREGRATAIIGVPRFYEALYAAIETRVGQRGRLVSTLFHGALALSTTLRRWWGMRPGRWLFTALHKEFGPRLRVVASGGAALDPALAWKLEGLGWQVATGYGLTETSPILTFNSPGAGRLDTAGKPLPGVELRVAPPAPQAEHGEVLVKGPNVFAGYRRLPDKTAEGFTDDGYFRTGDLGYIDNAGYLHLVGRASSMIVLPGGENVWPEKVEDALTHSEDIREAGVLERNGRLVALIVPETSAQDVDQALDQRIRDAIARQSQRLPSHHQISDYALTFDSLPRTRLGKLRRHSLAERYAQAELGGAQPSQERGPLPLEQMAPEDRQLLDDPVARHVWNWLGQRFADVRLTPDANMQLDLGVDSLAWLNLTLEIRERTGAELDEEAIGRVETVRDLLRETTEAEQGRGGGADLLQQLRRPEELLNEHQRQALAQPGAVTRTIGKLLFGLARALMRRVFQLEVRGQSHLPPHGPLVLTPNHSSFLDPLAIAAAMPDQLLRHTYWGGWTGIMFTNPVMRLVSRATGVVPIDPQRGPLSSLAFGAAIAQRGHVLIWFPEGERSPSGTLQSFRPGIGLVLSAQPVPVVPVYIAGAFDALPRGQWWPQAYQITVTFGEPADPHELACQGEGDQSHDRIATALHDRVAALGGTGP
jgi:long-chain acyl-CoA synthetase